MKFSTNDLSGYFDKVKTKISKKGKYFELARLEEIVNTKKIAIKRYLETYQHTKSNHSAFYEFARLMIDINFKKAE